MNEDRDRISPPALPPAPEVTILVPVLFRAHRARPFLESLEAATPEPHATLFLATAGDLAMLEAVEDLARQIPTVSVHVMASNARGDYAKKINSGIRHTSSPFVFTAADDLHFHPGWWPAARALFDDPAVGLVGTQDLAPTERARAGEHSTHFAVRRTYVERFGTIDERGKLFHEGYPHEYVDDEAVATAKLRGAWAFAGNSVVEHLHPSWGKAPRDKLYNAQGRRMAQGRALFQRRRKLWTPTPSR